MSIRQTLPLALIAAFFALAAFVLASPAPAYAAPVDDDCIDGLCLPPPPPPSPDPEVNIVAAPASIEAGNESRLTWYAEEVTSCSINQGIGSVGTSGHYDVSPSVTTTYTVTCTGSYGSASDSQTVTVTEPPEPVGASCSVSPETTTPGTQVTWSGYPTSNDTSNPYEWVFFDSSFTKICSGGSGTTNIQHTCPSDMSSCSAAQEGDVCREADIDCSGVPGAGGSENPGVYYGTVNKYRCESTGEPPVVLSYSWSGTDGLSGSGTTAQKTYSSTGTKSGTFHVSSSGGTASATCSTRVVGVPTATLTASPTSIVGGSGNSANLNYSCSNATSASINQGVGDVSGTSGSVSVSPGSTTTYTLTCYGETQTATDTATVTVTAAPTLTASCSVSPLSINPGGTATWTASASGGTGAYAYSWSGSDGLSGSTAQVSKQYNSPATKNASVTVTSGAQSITRSCNNTLSVSCPSGQSWDGNSCEDNTPAPTCSLSASGQTLTWSTNNASSCTLNGSSVGTSGSQSGATPGPYLLSCSGAGGSCTDDATVGAPSCGSAQADISASPTRVREGGTADISWAASGVDGTCTITENGTTIATVSGVSCNIPNGSDDRTITTQTVYRISCDGGEDTAEVVVNLIPEFEEF